VKYFWLTWSERKQDYVRRATGETLASLVKEANRIGCRWQLEQGRGGMWFEFDEPGSRHRPKRGRR
jgi:hypothetical protein